MAWPYLDSLIREIESSSYQNHSTASLLFGAGEWGLAPEEYLLKLKSVLQSRFKFNQDCEVTVECSPASLNAHKLKTFKKTGANRISLNLFHSHNRKLKKAVSDSKKLGINNFNFDLYFGKPGQNLISWRKDLERSVSLDPTHLSLYSFGPPRVRKRLKQELYYQALNFMSQRGYEQYEICHFCLPGFESRQNLFYWQRRNYLGFGAGSASLWNDMGWKNTTSFERYIKLMKSKGNARIHIERLNKEEQLKEITYFSLRQTAGLDCERRKANFGYDIYKSKKRVIDDLIEKGLLSLRRNRLCLTKEGFLIADDLIARLL